MAKYDNLVKICQQQSQLLSQHPITTHANVNSNSNIENNNSNSSNVNLSNINKLNQYNSNLTHNILFVSLNSKPSLFDASAV